MESHLPNFYEDLFTDSGNGNQNMVDFFREMSHGTIDIGQSRVFGWITLNHSSTEVTSGNRGKILEWARKAAVDNGIHLGTTEGLAVILNDTAQTFAYVSTRECVLDNAGWFPSIAGQEMGHGYGLQHSRLDGNAGDYKDQWDIMSTWSAYWTTHPEYIHIGPGLNAANMKNVGWIDMSRVWENGKSEVDTEMELRSLHQRQLPGYLAAFLNDYYWIEFRVKEGWDLGIPRPTVLVHYLLGGYSYLVKDTKGNKEGTKGSAYFSDPPPDPFPGRWKEQPLFQVKILDIDPVAMIARISIKSKHGKLWRLGAKRVSRGVMTDGGGWVIIGNKIVHVPPRNPLYNVINSVSNVFSADRLKNVKAKRSVRQKAYENIMKAAREEIEHLHFPGGISKRKKKGH